MDRRSWARLHSRPDTPAIIAERLRHREAEAIVARERAEKFPTITAENVEEVLAWQEARLAELKAAG